MDPRLEFINHLTRRTFIGQAARGIGGIALGSMLLPGLAAKSSPAGGALTLPGLPHFAPKAKRVICLFQSGGLSHGQKQWLEIAMLVAQDPELLLVDEPVAGLTDEETEHTGELLRQLAGDHTVLVIEHDMDFIRDLQAPVTVLHEGHVLCEGSMEQVQNDPRVIEVYLGSETQEAP
jgi:ABC-type transport system involved in cytochrome bd biosynthesis fused ATPase/permease subunit